MGEFWSWIEQWGTYIKVGGLLFLSVLLTNVFKYVLAFFIKKYFTSRDDDIKELFDSRNEHDHRITILETEHKGNHDTRNKIQLPKG